MTNSALQQGASVLRRAARKARSVVSPDTSESAPKQAAPGSGPRANNGPGKQNPKKAAAPAAPEIDPRFQRSFWRNARNVLGADVVPAGDDALDYDAGVAHDLAFATRRAKLLSTFGEQVGRGVDIEVAHASTIRELMKYNERGIARAFTLGLESLPEGQRIRHVGIGLFTHGLHLYDLAWRQFAKVDPAVLARVAPVEAVQCALADGSPKAREAARAVVADPAVLSGADLVESAGRMLVMGEPELARTLIEAASQRDESEFDEHHLGMLANVRRWTHPADVPTLPTHGINFGVIDYFSPDYERSSNNVGDYVQTLAMLGNLARFRGTRFHGADGLGELMTGLQSKVRPELEIPGGDADVNLVAVSRDYSEGDTLPADTWALAFGWHMHPLFRLRYGLPYHKNLNPIFVSFHVQRIDALTEETITYLKQHGPIGCRDWTTVDLLLSAGVEAFFTGCLTTTVSAVFPHLDQVEKDPNPAVAVIDLPANVGRKAKLPVERFSHGDPMHRSAGLAEGTHGAYELLSTYQSRYRRILTSRLHSYLPATSLGVKVAFRPHVKGDVRFEGLYGMEPQLPAFEEMRDGIRELIRETFSMVFEGAEKEAVYARWREITAPRVAEARRRFDAPAPQLDPGFDLAAAVAGVRANRRPYGPHEEVVEGQVTDIALSTDANFREYLAVTLESIVSNASGPIRVWVTTRGLGEDYYAWLSSAFPQVPMTFLPFDGIDYGAIGRMIRHITVTTMDRLLLPDVLAELDKITYIDIDTVTEGDVCALASVDLQGMPLAARTSAYSGALQWRMAGNALRPAKAAELRRTMSARHPFDFVTFNAGVLVLDLARMRSDNFIAEFVPMAGNYGLNDQDILNAYVGANRVELDKRWNALPVQETVVDPGIVHFAGAGKPWDEELTPFAEYWAKYATQVDTRLGTPAP